MLKLLRKNDLASGVILGIIMSLLVTSTIANPEPVQIAPVVIEKKVVIKVPIRLTPFDKKQIDCISDNIYYESNNQSKSGKIAVASVVLNRTKTDKFPSTACSVVSQRTKRVCQFSWKCEHKKTIINKNEDIVKIAEDVYLENIPDNTHGSLFYHASYVNPKWRGLKKTVTIGDHIFYTYKT
jgi:spore germination cell wall hydrolase CwlJ-like protein